MVMQLIAQAVFLYITNFTGREESVYYQYSIAATGITGVIVLLITIPLYRRDGAVRKFCGLTAPERKRPFTGCEGVWLLFMGAAFAQAGNILMSYLQIFMQYTEYQENMAQITQGKSLLMQVFWMGLVCPAAEEVVFRGLVHLRIRDYLPRGIAAVISGVIFGVYHMNPLQGIYAGILGIVFAYMLEMTGSLWGSILLHMGANIWSLVFPVLGEMLVEREMGFTVLGMFLGLMVIMIIGVLHFAKKDRSRRRRWI